MTDTPQQRPDTQKRLEEIRQRAEKATKGPWHARMVSGIVPERREIHTDGILPADTPIGEFLFATDGEFAAHSREDIPFLLSVIAAQQTALARFVKIAPQSVEYGDWPELQKAVTQAEKLLPPS